MGGPPPKKKTGLIIGIVVAAVVVLGGGATALILLLGGGGGDAKAAADKLATAFSENKAAPLAELTCRKPNQEETEAFNQVVGSLPGEYSVKSEPNVNEDAGTATVVLVGKPPTGGPEQELPLQLKQNDEFPDGWCAQFGWENYPPIVQQGIP
ncbi:hypothetical protein EV191_1011061 [Tamaricihabitans halophyticus]|uniref:Uncharacterized protein n=2 Tax=Tamaricihabitans halophyticus TaxID=1262583 RepID=A0A4R2R5N2_9PSEU|nr:hypothetical protein EV191_1011061 [Tamaricihabitans halophyticus]